MLAKPLPKTSDLVNPNILSLEFSLHNKTVQRILDAAELTPVMVMPYGKGFLRLYEPGPARDAIRATLPKPVAAPTPVVPNVDLGVLEERIEALTVEVAAVREQNRALFAYLRDHIGAPVAKLVAELGGVQT
jgi:hypothetical protein